MFIVELFLLFLKCCLGYFEDSEKGGTLTVADFIGAARKGKYTRGLTQVCISEYLVPRIVFSTEGFDLASVKCVFGISSHELSSHNVCKMLL